MSVVTVRDTEQLLFVFIYYGEVFPFLQSVRLGMGGIMRISHAEGPAETRPLSKYYYRVIPVFMQEIHILCSGGE